MTDTLGNELIRISAIDGETGVYIRDELGGGSAHIYTENALDPRRASPDWFPLPVDVAVSFEASKLTFDHLATVTLRDADAEYLGTLTEEPWELDGRAHFLEAFAGMKIYAYIDGASFEGVLRDDGHRNRSAVIDFEDPTRIVLGARSSHERPLATMTVPDDPDALLEAFSYLGSSIKEFTVERSWPTLRGHPPTVERGATLRIPPRLEKPDTGVTIAVPPTYAAVYRVAPLAFYLGADLVPTEGSEAELRLDLGYTEPLGRGRELEAAVDEMLARCLVLDSLVRVDGYYSLPRYEYDEIAPSLHFYPPELYDLSLDERLLEYFEVPFTDLEPYVPRWPVTGVLQPDPADAALVPPLLTSLGRIHVDEDGPPDGPTERSTVSPSTVTGYTTGNPPAGGALLGSAGFDHARDAAVCAPSEVSTLFVAADETCAACLDDTSWETFAVVGDGPAGDTLDVTSRAHLRRLLARDVDVLYYGGPTTEDGFVCPDGVLSFDAIDDVGATTFVLAEITDSTSVTSLVDGGAAAGLVIERTPSPESVGHLARYLAVGYPFALSATLADLPPARFVGDATVTLTKRKNGNVPTIADVVSVDEDTHEVSIRGTLTEDFGLGSVTWFDADYHVDAYQLSGVDLDLPTRLSTTEIAELAANDCIVRLNGEIHHGDGLTEADVRRSIRRSVERDLDCTGSEVVGSYKETGR